MSFDFRTVKEPSNDPVLKYISSLQKTMQKFSTAQQVDQLEGSEDLFGNISDTDSAIRFNNLNSLRKFTYNVMYYPPFEPDHDKLKLWLRGTNMGSTLKDWSTFNRECRQRGDPLLVDGAPFDDGTNTGGVGVNSKALRFNRNPAIDDYLTVTHDSAIRASEGLSSGISFFIRFRVFDIDQSEGDDIRLFEKVDNTPVTDGVDVRITDTGRLAFSLENGNNQFNVQTSSNTIDINTVYDAWFTYNKSGDVQKIYVNGVDKSLTSGSAPEYHGTLTDFDYTLMSKGSGSGFKAGSAWGDIYDYRIYREKVVSPTEVTRFNTNKWSISNIGFGQVMVPNYWATYDETPALASYTSTSYTSTSYTT